MAFDEYDFVIRVSPYLEGFERASNGSAVFRCPICGDSARHRHKRRGNLFYHEGSIIFHCYRCGENLSLYNFLKYIQPELAREFSVERFKARTGNLPKSRTVARQGARVSRNFFDDSPPTPTDELPSLYSLPSHHPARKYIESRRIGNDDLLRTIKYASSPVDWLEKHTQVKISNSEPKVVFSLRNWDGEEFGIVMRSILPSSKLRYQTILFKDGEVKSYGQERINKDKKKYVVEGIMDSHSIKNSIAALDSSLHVTAKKLNLLKDETTLIFDNEPRNRWIVANMYKAVAAGWEIAFWPKHIIQKDLNQCVQEGVDIEQILSNAFSKHRAFLELTNWKMIT